MSTFRATLAEFCAGALGLPEVVAALQDELARDRSAIFDDSALVDWAWRNGRIDDDVYRTLRDAITRSIRPDVAPAMSAQEPWPEIRATRDDRRISAFDPITDATDRTLCRTPGDSARAWSSAPSSRSDGRSWGTDSPHWSEAAPADVRPGAVLKERFVLEELIGRGGMGAVYKARDIRKEEAQDRHPFIAVKVLNEDFRRHPESFKALQREAKKSQSLAHPNVASVFDFDRDGATVFLVMELLEGESLQALIENSGRRGLPRGEVQRILRSIGAALSYAHHKGVVHSDFKPANAIRTRDGGVKVLDFGIARAIARPEQDQADPTRFNVSGLHALTPAYASCEMLLGEPAHPSDDVYALGCVAYELLSGRHPFGHVSALLAERQGLKPDPIEKLDRRSWRALVNALAFSRSERTQSIDQFLEEFGAKSRVRPLWYASAAGLGILAIGAAFYVYVPSADSNANVASAWAQSANERVRTWWGSWSRAETPGSPSPKPAPVSTEIAAPPMRNTVEPTLASHVSPPEIDAKTDVAPSVAAPTPTPVAAFEPPSTDLEEKASAPAPEFSLAQMKERLLAFGRADEVPEALDLYRALQMRLPPEDPFLRVDAPRAIAQAYARLGERAFVAGNYTVALALLERANELTPDLHLFQVRRDQMQRVFELEEALGASSAMSAAQLSEQLRTIRESEGSAYYAIRTRLADVLAARIERLQRTSPALANELLDVGRQAFIGAVAIESLSPVESVIAPSIQEGAAKDLADSALAAER